MRRLSVFLVVAVVATIVASHAAEPASGKLSPSQPSVRWTGGPITGAAGGPDSCSLLSCDEFSLEIDIRRSLRERSTGGVAVRIEWTDPEADLDLYVYDPSGGQIARSVQIAGTFEQIFLSAPAQGTYVIRTVAFDGIAITYSGRAFVSSSGGGAARGLPNTMRFGAPTIVDPQMSAAEPGTLATPDGTTYVTALTALDSLAGHVWRSKDGSRTFELLDSRIGDSFSDPRRGPCSAALGGGDADVILDRTGRLYFADLEGLNVNVATSTDGGDTWRCNALAATRPLDDRPWLAPAPTADGTGPGIDAYLAYTDSGTVSTQPLAKKIKPFEIHLEVTDDGGTTWKPRSTYAGSLIHVIGRLFVSPDGTLYHAFTGENAVWLARLRDHGSTVDIVKVSQRVGSPANIFIVGDADAAGNVFVAWVDGGTFDVFLASSSDRGTHWSAPVRLNQASSETAVMPWVAAGRTGDVAVAWYGTAASVLPEIASPTTRWHAWVARSLNASEKRPKFEVAPLSQTPVHFGPICLAGQNCEDPNTRILADFFQIDIAPDGAVVAAFNDNGRVQDTFAQPYVMVARQVAGLGMPRSSAVTATMLERGGDARFPPHSTKARNVPALDFMTAPVASLHGDRLRVSFRIASADDLASALTASNSGVATAATWLVTWKANDRVEYVAMAMDVSGATRFFGGDHPGAGDDIRLFPTFTYPQQFPLKGTVDTKTGRVTIDVPLAPFHLKPGDTLHGLQAFSLTGIPEAAGYISSQLTDTTPSHTFRVGAAAGAPVSQPRSGLRRTEPSPRLPATGLPTSPLAPLALAAAAGLAVWLGRSRRGRLAR